MKHGVAASVLSRRVSRHCGSVCSGCSPVCPMYSVHAYQRPCDPIPSDPASTHGSEWCSLFLSFFLSFIHSFFLAWIRPLPHFPQFGLFLYHFFFLEFARFPSQLHASCFVFTIAVIFNALISLGFINFMPMGPRCCLFFLSVSLASCTSVSLLRWSLCWRLRRLFVVHDFFHERRIALLFSLRRVSLSFATNSLCSSTGNMGAIFGIVGLLFLLLAPMRPS